MPEIEAGVFDRLKNPMELFRQNFVKTFQNGGRMQTSMPYVGHHGISKPWFPSNPPGGRVHEPVWTRPKERSNFRCNNYYNNNYYNNNYN